MYFPKLRNCINLCFLRGKKDLLPTYNSPLPKKSLTNKVNDSLKISFSFINLLCV